MGISINDVEHVALLARLAFSDKEKEEYAQQLSDILGYMDKLNTLDTEEVEPTAHVLPLKNVFREDRAEPGLKREAALQNAPEKEDGQFKVPKIGS